MRSWTGGPVGERGLGVPERCATISRAEERLCRGRFHVEQGLTAEGAGAYDPDAGDIGHLGDSWVFDLKGSA